MDYLCAMREREGLMKSLRFLGIEGMEEKFCIYKILGKY